MPLLIEPLESAMQQATTQQQPVDETISWRTSATPGSTRPAKSVSAIALQRTGVMWRVSSSHLILASPYFQSMFTRAWAEAQTLGSDQCIPITMENWDEETFSILMNIIHGLKRQVPQTVDLTTLTKIAVLVDYFQCQETTELWSDRWIKALSRQRRSVREQNRISWILIAQVFAHKSLFKEMTSWAITQSTCPIDTMGLPISPHVVGE
jgi:hypothetical protein